ncbi:MAG TPA: hypothetical protein VK723_05340, partial [Thermoplasmata archaeon]|nr:hypothetical protein [Thermoplasmata archaeon]
HKSVSVMNFHIHSYIIAFTGGWPKVLARETDQHAGLDTVVQADAAGSEPWARTNGGESPCPAASISKAIRFGNIP